MSRKIDALLRIVSEIQHLDECSDSFHKGTIISHSEELSESELDLVAAAATYPLLPDRQKTDN